MAKPTRPGDPLFDDPTAYLFTDGSAPPNVTFPGSPETQALWGPVIKSATRPAWIDATRPTSTTGELSAINQALAWIRKRRKTLPPDIRPRCNLVSDSDHSVKLFANRSIKPVANKRLIARINDLLNQVK